MTQDTISRPWLRVPEVAEQLAVDAGKILGWIRAGQLAAVNVAKNANGRPRWRISRQALDEFLGLRQSQPAAVPRHYTRRPKRAVKQYV